MESKSAKSLLIAQAKQLGETLTYWDNEIADTRRKLEDLERWKQERADQYDAYIKAIDTLPEEKMPIKAKTGAKTTK